MQTRTFLKKVAYKSTMDIDGKPHEVYLSKFDNSYITFVGLEKDVRFFAKHEITEQLTHGVGFSPKEGKWYGWSHRAIYGFQVGSTCKKGDCHYVAPTPEELIDDHANFFLDISLEDAEQHRAECQILDDKSGIRILHTPIVLHMASSIEEAEQAINNDEISDIPEEAIDLGENGFTIVKCGHGEWTAETLEDAKQMAIDFNEGVS